MTEPYKTKSAPGGRFRRLGSWTAAVMIFAMAMVFLHQALLGAIGAFLVVDDPVVPSDAAAVLSTGMEYYPRLSEAAQLYREGVVPLVVINGDRKSEALRRLETAGFIPCCPWYEESLRILAIYGVPRDHVMIVEAPDVYDTVTEALVVGDALARKGITRVIVTSSKSHTRRALYIWKRIFGDRFVLQAAAAREDPYEPSGWWREGRQIRRVLAEYGAWPYGWLKLRRLAAPQTDAR